MERATSATTTITKALSTQYRARVLRVCFDSTSPSHLHTHNHYYQIQARSHLASYILRIRYPHLYVPSLDSGGRIEEMHRLLRLSAHTSSGTTSSQSQAPQLPELPPFSTSLWDHRDSSEDTPSPHSSIPDAFWVSSSTTPVTPEQTLVSTSAANFHGTATPASSITIRAPPDPPLPPLTRVTTLPPQLDPIDVAPLGIDVDLV